MNHLLRGTLRGLRRLRRLVRPDRPLFVDGPFRPAEETNALIRERISSAQPCMISRFGSVELETTVRYLDITDPSGLLTKAARFVRGRIGHFWWDPAIAGLMSNNAGFFPATDEMLCRFARRILEDIPMLDVLGSWQRDEERLAHLMPHVQRVRLRDLEPWWHADPWSRDLAGRTVLVIHPFAKTIESQYEKRELIWPGRPVLPEFRLKTLKAVQSIAGTPTGFPDWFAALDWMCDRISATEFDVAIIGAGAYGMPLAAHVKRSGKKAVHMGGSVQMLFGIRGRRWEQHAIFREPMNEHWVRPLPEERPPGYDRVEGGAYW